MGSVCVNLVENHFLVAVFHKVSVPVRTLLLDG